MHEVTKTKSDRTESATTQQMIRIRRVEVLLLCTLTVLLFGGMYSI